MTPRKDGDLQEKINDSRLQKNPTCKNFHEVLILGGYVQNAASVEVEKNIYIFVYRYRYISVYMERDIGYTYRYLLTYISSNRSLCTRTQEKGAVSPQETDPDLPVSVWESPAEAWVSGGLLQGWGH